MRAAFFHCCAALRIFLNGVTGMTVQDKSFDISIRQIQIFLKAVELRNFTKVAEHFSFTPSMVSKTISSIEDVLQLQLFVRKPHELTPTPAAEQLTKEWQRLVGSFKYGIKKAQSIQNGLADKIMLGFVDSSDTVDAFMKETLLAYKAVAPDMDVIAEKHDMHRLSELLRNGMLDIIQTSSFETAYLEEYGISWEQISVSNAAAFVPRGNPLFERESLSFEDLIGQPLFALDANMHPTYTAWLNDLCRQYGFEPNIVGTYRTVRSMLFGLKLHDSIFIGDSITSDWCDDTLRCFPLPEKVFSLLAWKSPASPSLRQFKDFLKGRYTEEAKHMET